MSHRHPLFGLLLASFGALVITPDTLFMRISGMSGTALMGWRGLSMGLILLTSWALIRRSAVRYDLKQLVRGSGLVVIVSHTSNSALFSLGIANAPVAVVLFATATTPVFAALFAQFLSGERAGRASWIATASVLCGIALAVFGRDMTGVGLNLASLLGALAGLGVAMAMAMTFVTVRHAPELPIMAAMGIGSLISGCLGLGIVGAQAMTAGTVWAALVSGVLILPLSFVCLTFATRHTAAVNVSLLLLLEAILGPVWVWWGFGEVMSWAEICGGAIVITTLAIYLTYTARQNRAAT